MPARELHVAIRCDADPINGTGHVTRCLALAQELRRRGHRVTWISRIAGVPWLGQLIDAGGWSRIEPPDDEAHLPALLAELNTDWVVVDSYRLPTESIAAVASVRQVLAIVDDATPAYPAALYVSPAINPRWQAPAAPGHPAAPGVEVLGGPDFVLIRSELRRLRRVEPGELPDRVDRGRLVAIAGGADSAGLGPILADLAVSGALPAPLLLYSAHPAVVAAAGWSDPVGSGAGAGGWTPLLEVRPPDPEALATAAAEARLAITPAGVTSWELLFLGVPTGLIAVADNQRPNYDTMTARDWAAGLGSVDAARRDPAGLAERIGAVWSDPAAGRARAEAAMAAVDGRGVERVVDRLVGWPSPAAG